MAIGGRSRIIGKGEAQAADRWDFPPVDASAADALRGAHKGGAHLLTAGQLDALQRQVHEEAYRRGFDEGLAAGKAELAARSARLAAMADAFVQPLQNLDAAIEDELVNLAISLATHLVRREIERDPTLLQAAVRECLAVLATGVRDVTIHLHPDDAGLLRSQLMPSGDIRFTIADDPALARGDLRIASGSSLVDGALVARCAEIVAAARSDTRAADSLE
jgi:flagellar assembly protein FliH